jgi:hypothetical protein
MSFTVVAECGILRCRKNTISELFVKMPTIITETVYKEL